jgi:hypothetical protein
MSHPECLGAPEYSLQQTPRNALDICDQRDYDPFIFPAQLYLAPHARVADVDVHFDTSYFLPL